jgi:EAL domain-containing protein (putative c-di-GMP-specific phosphodiesterase class I)
MAFHPIVDVEAETVWGYEALVRGTGGETALSLLDRVTDHNRFRFDVACRVKAIELAGELFPRNENLRLAINIMPDAIQASKNAIKSSLEAARRVGFDHRRVLFEFNETKRTGDVSHLAHMIDDHRRIGFKTAIDDFGTGYAGLAFIAKAQPDLIKIDMDLIRGIGGTPGKQMVVAGIVSIARGLNIEVAAEGIETVTEVRVLRAAGVRLQQGYYFAKPKIGLLPSIRGLAASREALVEEVA